MHESLDSQRPPAEPGRDRETVALLHAGDARGLCQLLADHGALVRLRLRQRFGNMLDHADLEDVMESASVRAWQAATRFDTERGTLRAWLSVIARNCALRLIENRRRNVVELAGDLDQILPKPMGLEAPSSDRQRLFLDLTRCLDKLPPLQRAVLKADLEAGDPVPAAQLARRLATSANSIYVSRLKGRRALRTALQGLGHFVHDLPTNKKARPLGREASQDSEASEA